MAHACGLSFLRLKPSPLVRWELAVRVGWLRRRSGSAAKPTVRQKPGRSAKPCAQKSDAAKPGQRKPNKSRSSAAKPTQRHTPVNCCGRRKQDCKCFTTGRGLEIVRSLKRKQIDAIPARVRKSRIQTWHDTGDMPGYMRQTRCKASMRYSWLFPIAFTWRHFSNEEFWKALQALGSVKVNQQPNFSIIEEVMRAFERAGVSYHGGLFYSGSALTAYRFGNAAKLPEWQKCQADEDFITKKSGPCKSCGT